MIKKLKKRIHLVGASNHPVMKKVAAALRFLAVSGQYQLLFVQKDPRTINLIKRIHQEKEFMLWPYELFLIHQLASKGKNLKGDFAEVGVYKGGSAKLICEAKGAKKLHLFDTFEGLPKPNAIDGADLKEKQYTASLAQVKAYLRRYKNVYYYTGLFPKTSSPVKQKKFSFVHLDVDLYQPTLDCLEFFYPRMVRGGMILSHDYSTLPGVKRAFYIYFKKKA